MDVKERIAQLKELTDKINSRTKKIIIIGAAVLIVGAVIIALILNNQPYETLFSGLSETEAQQITAKLQEDGIDFKYDGDDAIQVKKDVVDQTKATLVQEGYPKSGFTYDTYINNSGMMTTDSEKAQYELYDLQDRIGATIRMFDGVKEATVTIALGEQSRYVLSDDTTQASASVTVVMKDGGSPSESQVRGIQRLVSKSVPGMEMTNVGVFDGNGNDVSVESEEGKSANSSDAEEIARVVENQVISNVMKVLGPIYGMENVSVSARAQINMENLIRESITYNTPEKIDENDKTGIVDTEQIYREGAGADGAAGGVAGSETNSDNTEYNTDSEDNGTNAYSESISREYLVNQIKEQGQVSPGALDDLTVSVAINGTSFGSLRESQLRSLIGNAAGISTYEQEEKIAVVSAVFNGSQTDEPSEEASGSMLQILKGIPLWAIIAGIVLLLLVIALIVFFVIRSRRKAEEEEELEEEELAGGEEEIELPTLDLNQELQELQNDRGMELKRSIREFAEQNAEISAQLLRNWLNGGNGDGE